MRWAGLDTFEARLELGVQRQPLQNDGLAHLYISIWEARQRAGVVPSQARKAR